MFKEFQGRLTKFKTEVNENNVLHKFSIEFRSVYDVQNFLIDADEILNVEFAKYFNEPVCFDKLVLSRDEKADIKVEFDSVEFEAVLHKINVSRKYSAKDMSDAYKYELQFSKGVDKELDSIFVHYLNQTEEDENGRNYLIDFPIELTYIPPLQTNMFENEE
jgi:hypothetical protein